MFEILSVISLSMVSSLEPQERLFSERIEVRVGSEIITTFDLESQTQLLQQQDPQDLARDELVREARDQLINRKLIQESLSRAEMHVSDQDVDRRINRIRVSEGIPSMDEFRRVLEMQGMNMNSLRQQIRQQMEMEYFRSLIESQVSQTVQEEEMRSYYQNNPQMFSNQYELDVQECLIPYGEDRSRVEALKQTYKNQPESFNECVQNYSQSPTRQANGLIRNIRRGSLVESIERVIFEGEQGQVVSMEMPGAIRLFKVLEKRDLGPRSFEEVRDEIQSRIRAERLRRTSDRHLERLRNEAVIQIEASES